MSSAQLWRQGRDCRGGVSPQYDADKTSLRVRLHGSELCFQLAGIRRATGATVNAANVRRSVAAGKTKAFLMLPTQLLSEHEHIPGWCVHHDFG